MSRQRVWHLFLFIFLLDFFLGSGEIDTTDGYIRFHVAKSILERGQVDVGLMGDVGSIGSAQSVMGRNGRYYSFYEIGQSIFFLPLVTLGKVLGGAGTEVFLASLLNPLLSAALACLIFLISKEIGYSVRTSLFLTFLYSFGTFAWRYSKSFQQEPQEAFLSVAALFGWYLFLKTRRWGYWIGAILCLGLAVLSKVSLLVLLLPFGILLLRVTSSEGDVTKAWRRLARDAVFLVFGLLPFLAIHFGYNWVRFGHFGTAALVARTGTSSISDAFSNPLWVGLYGLLASPGKGIFWYAPCLVLSPVAFKWLLRRCSDLAWAFLWLVVAQVTMISAYVVWNGGWDWGPRYLLPVVPFALIPLGELLEPRASSTWSWARVLKSLALVGGIVQLPSIYVAPNVYYQQMVQDAGLKWSFFIESNDERIRFFNRILDAQIPRQFVIAKAVFTGELQSVLSKKVEPDLWIVKAFRKSTDKLLTSFVTISFAAIVFWVGWQLDPCCRRSSTQVVSG